MTLSDITEVVDAKDGTLRLRVYTDEHERKVKLEFHDGERIHRFITDPAEAVRVAESILDAARDCGYQIAVKVHRRQISEAVRNKLAVRFQHILRARDRELPLPVILGMVDQLLSAVD